jgi:hypothetical protein
VESSSLLSGVPVVVVYIELLLDEFVEVEAVVAFENVVVVVIVLVGCFSSGFQEYSFSPQADKGKTNNIHTITKPIILFISQLPKIKEWNNGL